MNEETVQITRDGVTLAGTLTLPAHPRGIVVCVHGSGPFDRDQNSKGARLNTFAVLSDALEEVGFAVLRFDKRGVGASGGDFKTLGQGDLLADLAAWVDFATDQGLGPLYILGHSEGTALAPAVAEGRVVAGFVLLCPYVTDGGDILVQQARQADAKVIAMTGMRGMFMRILSRMFGLPSQLQARFVAKLKRTKGPFVRVGLQKVPANWLRDFVTSDVAALHRANQRPTLVLVAACDAQCPPEDGAKIAAMNPNATLRVMDNLSHLLRQTDTDDLEDYARQLAAPNDPRVADAVTGWLLRQGEGKRV